MSNGLLKGLRMDSSPLGWLQAWLLRRRLGSMCFSMLTAWQRFGCPAPYQTNTTSRCLAAIGGPGSDWCIPSFRGVALTDGWSLPFEGMRPPICARTVLRLLEKRPPPSLLGGTSWTEASLTLGRHQLLVRRYWNGPAGEHPWKIQLQEQGGTFSRPTTLATTHSRDAARSAVQAALAGRIMNLSWAGLPRVGVPVGLDLDVTLTAHKAPAVWLGVGAGPRRLSAPAPIKDPYMRRMAALHQSDDEEQGTVTVFVARRGRIDLNRPS